MVVGGHHFGIAVFHTCVPSTVSKQINDKERVAAAMENPNLLSTVRRCIRDPE